MTQEKSQRNDPAGAGKATESSGTNPLAAKSGTGEPPTLLSSSPLPSAFSAPCPSSSDVPADSARESAVNKELRRLNRALLALSACNQALAQAGSEQALLRQICDIIVRLGGYRTAGIAYNRIDLALKVRSTLDGK